MNDTLIYKRTVSHPKRKGELITLKWSQNFRLIEIWYQNQLIQCIQNIQDKGNKFHFGDSLLGEVKVFLSNHSSEINITIDGIHSIQNDKHPSKSIRWISLWNVLGIIVHLIAVITIIDDMHTYTYFSRTYQSQLIYNIVFLSSFLFSFIFVMLKFPLLFLLGAVAYWVELLYLIYRAMHIFIGASGSVKVVIAFFGIYCFLLIIPLQKLRKYYIHKPYSQEEVSQLLDG